MKATKTVIEPTQNFSFQLAELWRHRELFYFFTWRDIKVKYKQTSLGILWALIQPLGFMALFTLVFSKNFQFASGDLRYEIFVLSGLILWNLFYSSVSMASESILQHSGMIKKIYFPRLIIPVSSLLAALFDFLIAFLAFFVFCAIFRSWPGWTAIYLFPLGILLTLLSAFGTGVFLSALNIKFRDFRYVVPFVLQFLFFASQIVYPLQSIRQPWVRTILSLNPVNGAIEIFRSAFTHQLDTTVVLLSSCTAVFLCLTGFLFFKKTEAYFADLS